MLVRVGLDPDAAVELAAGKRGPGGAAIRFLTERCLVRLDTEAAGSQLLKAFQECGRPEVAQAMVSLLSSRSHVVRDVVLSAGGPVVPVADMLEQADAESWSSLADLLLVAEVRLDLLGAPVRPEVATLSSAWNTAAYEVSDEVWQGLAMAGAKRADVWQRYFQPLAATGCDVYVIDRWAAVNLYEELLGRPRRTSERGAMWFLSAVARSQVRRVHLTCPERYIREKRLDPDKVHQAVRGWWHGLRSGSELDLKLVRGNFDHARGVAFDGWAGFSPHNGLASFDQPLLAERLLLMPNRRLADELRRDFLKMPAIP